tara:strand:+ start:3938 stop:4930 length:993 start_codon:yes stop_codon:yes gene_type:complete
MISKSYLIENEKDFFVKNSVMLFYGENLGLKRDFKTKVKNLNKNSLFVDFEQEEIIKNPNIFFNEISNLSLFSENKTIFINNATDKLLNIIEDIDTDISGNKIILFSNLLEKKSKLRNYFEKSKKFQIVACYPDNEISLKKILNTKLRDFQNLSADNINLILQKSNTDRIKLYNEIDKIIVFFRDKIIKNEKLEALLDANINEDFNILKEQAFSGNKINTNRLLADTNFDKDKNAYYLNLINQRLIKLREIYDSSKYSNIETAINNMKPPIFWKDKANILFQLKKWDLYKIKAILSKTYQIEINIKSGFFGNTNILLKKLIIDICELANA